MKKLALTLGLAIVATVPAMAAPNCADTGTPAANVALVKHFYDGLNDRSQATLDAILAPDWVDIPLAPGQAPGAAGMKAALDGYVATFPDFHAKNEEFIAEGNRVVVRSTITATQKGAFAGYPGSGKRISIMAIDVHTVCRGKIVQTYHVENWLAALFQIGAAPLH